jgi:hypothetical protein
MDLRGIDISGADLTEMKSLISRGMVAYQPILFRDDLEVGEGLAFATHTSDSWPPRKEVVHWPGHPSSLDALAVSHEHIGAFRSANAALRTWYEDNVRLIAELLGGVVGYDFLELGCNAGYLLHRLSAIGARRAIGVDVADFGDVFDWFNRVTHSSSEFVRAEWDSAQHGMTRSLPSVDVAISVSVSCHVADPLHMLAYLCHLARSAVFFMTPLSGKDDVSLTFRHPPNYFRQNRDWPASFDSEVLPSASLVELGLEQCGFGDIRRPKDNVFVGIRTGPGHSIYDSNANTPLSACLLVEGYRGAFNIIRVGPNYYALAQDEGEFALEKVQRGEYRRCVVASSMEELKRRLEATVVGAS